jgi:hypothetical protein
MFYKAKVAVCSEIRTKHINAMWAPCRIFLILNLVLRKVTARLWKVKVQNDRVVFLNDDDDDDDDNNNNIIIIIIIITTTINYYYSRYS